MRSVNTRYGALRGITSVQMYNSGLVKECVLNEYNVIETSYGKLIPQYEQDDGRRKYNSSISFYDDGNLKAISLNEQMTIKTSAGTYKAERITFYEDGSVKRIFPLDGKLTGYWTEENEYELAESTRFSTGCGRFRCKVVGIAFYKSQKIKSLTLWPKERVKLMTPLGEIEVRKGISLYESGVLKSCEPATETELQTPIGKINAYDVNAVGISGDENSVIFYEDGRIMSIVTSSSVIEVYKGSKLKAIYEETEKPGMFNLDIMDKVPVSIEFYGESVYLNGDEYKMDKYSFKISTSQKIQEKNCGNCSSCTFCAN